MRDFYGEKITDRLPLTAQIAIILQNTLLSVWYIFGIVFYIKVIWFLVTKL